MATEKPGMRPANPHFSSGPCAKRPGWKLEVLAQAALGRSHRARVGKSKLKQSIDLTREVLRVPSSHRIAMVPASDTGAVELALWSLLGSRGVDMLVWESFGESWASDAARQLKLKDCRIIRAEYGGLPRLSDAHTRTRDVVFTWNGTTSGVRVPNADWIAAEREGLVICDATSAAFAQALEFAKLDVVTFSWQKALGGEAAHGMIVLSPRAVERLESYSPPWPLPKIFQLTKAGKLNEAIFQGETINTPSLLCVEDYLHTLNWAKSIGGLDALFARANANAAALSEWVTRTPWVEHLAKEPQTRSNTSVCLMIADPEVRARGTEAVARVAKGIAASLEGEGVAFDIGAHRDAPPGLRIWCGATVETSDIRALMPWLDWAFERERAALRKAA
ncbi:MAG: phosphoserine transaminase [Hyphomicrobiales bacterium]|nr:phosphoserine transaminase [Hyphomicrobiales bacterium]